MATMKTAWGDVQVPDDATDDQIDKIVDDLRAKNAPQDGPGFWSTLGSELKKANVDPLANLVMGAFQAQKQGGQPGLAQYAASIPPQMLAGMWGASLPHTQAAIDAFKQGNYGQALGQAGAALPVVGPQLFQTGQALGNAIRAGRQQPYDQPLTQPYRQALGKAAAQGINLGALLAPEEALDAAGAGVRGAAAKLYQKTAGFPQAMSREEALAAAQLAIKEKLPLGGFLGAYGGPDETLARIGNPKSGIIGDNMDQVEKLVQQNGATQLDMNTALKDVTDAIDKWRSAPNGDNVADQMQGMLKDFLKNKGLGIYDHKTGELVGWKPISMRQAQDLKQGAYGILPSGIFSDTKDGWGATQKEFNKLIASGLRKAQNEAVPELEEFNNNVHNAINLKDRIEELDKKGIHFGWSDLVPMAGGLMIGAVGPATGHPLMYSPEALGATALGYTLSRPQTASRTAIAMGGVGRGPISQAAAIAPRIAALEREREQFQSDIASQLNLPQAKGLDTSKVPVSKNIPISQIPMLIDTSVREQYDPKAPDFERLTQLAHAVAGVESGMGENVGPSPKGALGVMQLMPDAAQEMGIKPEERSDAAKNIKAGTGYLIKLYKKYKGDIPTTVAAYNFGQGHIDRGDPLPPETEAYIDNIMSRMQSK